MAIKGKIVILAYFIMKFGLCEKKGTARVYYDRLQSPCTRCINSTTSVCAAEGEKFRCLVWVIVLIVKLDSFGSDALLSPTDGCSELMFPHRVPSPLSHEPLPARSLGLLPA